MFALPANATLADADTLLAGLTAALAAVPAGGGTLHIDASPLLRFDTSLVALLLHARRAAQAAGGTVELVGAPPRLADLAQLYGVESLLPPAAVAPAAEPPAESPAELPAT